MHFSLNKTGVEIIFNWAPVRTWLLWRFSFDSVSFEVPAPRWHLVFNWPVGAQILWNGLMNGAGNSSHWWVQSSWDALAPNSLSWLTATLTRVGLMWNHWTLLFGEVTHICLQKLFPYCIGRIIRVVSSVKAKQTTYSLPQSLNVVLNRQWKQWLKGWY